MILNLSPATALSGASTVSVTSWAAAARQASRKTNTVVILFITVKLPVFNDPYPCPGSLFTLHLLLSLLFIGSKSVKKTLCILTTHG